MDYSAKEMKKLTIYSKSDEKSFLELMSEIKRAACSGFYSHNAPTYWVKKHVKRLTDLGFSVEIVDKHTIKIKWN